ncbi:hypothetical protein EON76_01150 [bacterium]|nr:MAG: hypothetical protein EON76_01150 [bacterium]
MRRHDYINTYLGENPKIRVFFDVKSFLNDETITLEEEDIAVTDALGWYVPKYSKAGAYDDRNFEIQKSDKTIVPLTLGRVSLNPSNWGLGVSAGKVLCAEDLNPVPIATDMNSGATLLLDSNHTLSNLLSVNKSEQALPRLNRIKTVSLKGYRLEQIIPDFEIINRQM